MLLGIEHLSIYSTEEFYGRIYRGHQVLLSAPGLGTYSIREPHDFKLAPMGIRSKKDCTRSETMKRKGQVAFSALLILATALAGTVYQAPSRAEAPDPALQSPVLKWQLAGCFNSWCETGWYSSPAVADLDGDGAVEVIASAYSIVILDGETGTLSCA
jgi:hypothetical protein